MALTQRDVFEMHAVLTLAGREFKAYFATPLGWVCLAAWLLVTGFSSLGAWISTAMCRYRLLRALTASHWILEAYMVAPFLETGLWF